VALFFIGTSFPFLPNLLALYVHPLGLLLRPWTIVTYMFVHASMSHLFFNMLGLFFFGPRLESRLGSKQFLYLYFLSGICGALLSFIFSMGIVIVGASGGVYGVLLGFAMFWPRDKIYIWGILPIEARWLIAAMTAITIYSGVGAVQNGVAHFAHLGGFVGAFLYIRWLERNSPARKFKAKMYAKDVRKPAHDGQDAERWARIRVDNLHELNRDEVERLLVKIKQSGIASLTLDERAFLNRVSAQ
jgi:membrane associated rhomboid family serine protease